MENLKNYYYTPSELSKLSGCSRQLLVYYDNAGIFKPAFTDEKGYRYYELWQWAVLEIILSLRNMDVPLIEIKDYISQPTVANLNQIYKNRLAVCEEQIEKLKYQKQQLECCIKPLESIEDITLNEIELVEIPQIQRSNFRTVYFAENPKKRVSTVAGVLSETIKECTTNDYLLCYGQDVEEFFGSRITHYHVFLKHIKPKTAAPKKLYLHLYAKFDRNNVPDHIKEKITDFLEENKLMAKDIVMLSSVNSHIFSRKLGERVNEIYIEVRHK